MYRYSKARCTLPGRPGRTPGCETASVHRSPGRPGRTPEKACRAMLFLRPGCASSQCEQTTCSGLTMKRARAVRPGRAPG